MSLSAQIFGRDSLIHRATNVLGLGIPGWLDRTFGPKDMITQVGKTDTAYQGSEYGADIAHLYGTCAMPGAQIVWMEHNKLKEKVKKSGGKGGNPVTETYTYFATFALLLCHGETVAIKRMWCGDKLIYNAASDDLDTIIASNNAAKGWTFYRGTDDQMPDSRYEAEYGVGNVPAFRGFTYIAFYDYALKDYGNSLQGSQFKVELVTKADMSAPQISSFDFEPDMQVPSLAAGNPCDQDGSANWVEVRNNQIHWYQSIFGTIRYRGVLTSGTGVSVFSNSLTDLQYAWYDSSYNLSFGRDGAIETMNFGYVFSMSESDGRMWINGNNLLYAVKLKSGLIPTAIISQVNPGLTGYPDYGIVSAYGEDCVVFVKYSRLTAAFIGVYDELGSLLRSVSIPASRLPSNVDFSALEWVGSTYGTRLYLVSPNISTTTEGYCVVIDIESGIVLSNAVISSSISNTTFPRSAGACVRNGLVYWSQRAVSVANYPNGRRYINLAWQIGRLADQTLDLGDVVYSECIRSSLIEPADIDVSLLTDQVTGYRVNGGTIRSTIEPLQSAYQFDCVPSGYRLKFVPRGQASVATIPWEDLAASADEEAGDTLTYTREMDSQLPQKVTINAISLAREYGATAQSYERLSTEAVNQVDVDVPLVLSDDQTAQMAEKLLFLRWLERDDYDLSLPPTYQRLEPADVVKVNTQWGQVVELRLSAVSYEADGRLSCKAKLNNGAIYSSTAVGGPSPSTDGTVPLAGPTVMVVADAPMIYESEQNTPGVSTAASGYTDGWPGALLVQSANGGQTWNEMQGYTGKATIGFARNALAANSGFLLQSGGFLQVDLVSGDLESVTFDQMMNGANIALYGNDGRWEVIRFQTATVQGDGSYRLTNLVRGDKGTEWATGTHKAGDQFVLASDPDNIFVGLSTASIGVPAVYRGITNGSTIDSASDIPVTYQGVNLKPLSPVVALGRRNSSSDLIVSFTRRSRFSSSWWVTGVVAPVGEASESYQADIMSGSTVKRTISFTSESFTYPVADQITDFGSAQASITLRIYQLSAVVGRGYPLEVTL